jgi:methionyl-tRNA formyltransferase
LRNKIVVFASGILGLRMLEYLITIIQIEFIATDVRSEAIISFAQKNRINIFLGKPNNDILYNQLKSLESNTLFSINYLFLLEQKVFQLFEYPINFHGSLLPKYRGRTPHIWSIINNENKTGITAHYIEKGCDEGDIIFQEQMIIEDHHTGFDILSLYYIKYPIIIKKVLEMINENYVIRIPQSHNLATFFPKRSPNDGQINWNWQKERLKNWVRALSNPYPGAFTYYQNKKIIIDQIIFSNAGFDNIIENGTIIAINPNNNPIVKVQNGTVELTIIRNTLLEFTINSKFEDENK